MMCWFWPSSAAHGVYTEYVGITHRRPSSQEANSEEKYFLFGNMRTKQRNATQNALNASNTRNTHMDPYEVESDSMGIYAIEYALLRLALRLRFRLSVYTNTGSEWLCILFIFHLTAV